MNITDSIIRRLDTKIIIFITLFASILLSIIYFLNNYNSEFVTTLQVVDIISVINNNHNNNNNNNPFFILTDANGEEEEDQDKGKMRFTFIAADAKDDDKKNTETPIRDNCIKKNLANFAINDCKGTPPPPPSKKLPDEGFQGFLKLCMDVINQIDLSKSSEENYNKMYSAYYNDYIQKGLSPEEAHQKAQENAKITLKTSQTIGEEIGGAAAGKLFKLIPKVPPYRVPIEGPPAKSPDIDTPGSAPREVDPIPIEPPAKSPDIDTPGSAPREVDPIPAGNVEIQPIKIQLGEIKSIDSYNKGLCQLAKRADVDGNTALVYYDEHGNVFMQVFVKEKNTRVIAWEGEIGKVTNFPSEPFGTAPFGNKIEREVIKVVEKFTKQKFAPKHPSSTGPDLVPE